MATSDEGLAELTGGCVCGRVRYSVPLEAVKFGFASCHCNACRRSHASPFVMWTGFAKEHADKFQVKAEQGDLSAFAHDLAHRHFCAKCGTHTHLVYDRGESRWSGEVHIPTATLDDACIPALERRVEALGKPRYFHVFFSDRAACLGDVDRWASARKFGGKTGTEPLEG